MWHIIKGDCCTNKFSRLKYAKVGIWIISIATYIHRRTPILSITLVMSKLHAVAFSGNELELSCL
jgi:hypothetical protein